MTIYENLCSAFRLSWRRLRAGAPFSLSFKLLQGFLIAPIIAGSLRFMLHRWGRASVGNFEIAEFLLSPPGVAAVVGCGAISLACIYLELAGLMRLLADWKLHWWQALLGSGRLMPRLIRLGVRQLVVYLLLAIPFVAGIGAVYGWLWHGRDLNGLIILQPPEFWLGAGLAGALGLAYVVVATRWFLRWILAVPTLLFEPSISVSDALRMSAIRTAGHRLQLLLAILIWLAIQSAITLAVFAPIGLVSMIAIDLAGGALTLALPVTATVLVADTVIATQLAVFSTMTFAGLVLETYRLTCPDRVLQTQDGVAAAPALRWIFATVLVLLAVTTSALSERLLTSLDLADQVEITAHRAGAIHGPENSVAALRQAIVDRADWAEIDVQLTRDKALVILHDIDLARIRGGNRRVDAVTLAEIRELDIGTSFGPQFAGERVPTLDEILSATAGQIRLNVELKPHGKADETALTERVVAMIQERGMVDRCVICSQSYESLQVAKRLEPRLPIGFIAATVMGDLTKLDVDFLMVKTSLVSRDLVERAALRKIPIHAWTVNDTTLVATLVDNGVKNIITDDPAAMRRQLDEIRNLSPIERLLLRARNEIVPATE